MTRRALLVAIGALFLVGGAEGAHLPFTSALFAAEADADAAPSMDDAWTIAELARVARLARSAARKGGSRADALNHTVFGELGFVREVDDPGLEFVFLSQVLRARRGSCVGLGTLYIALGEMLGWRIDGVMVPGHFFVRLEQDGTSHNIELLRKGEEMSDSWYRTRFPGPGRGAAEYGRTLAAREVLGVVEYDVGNARRREGRLSEARRAFRLSTSLFPGFAEAHASLGATEQLLGALDDALVSYRAARRTNPDLPGIERNIELLARELDRGARP